MRSALMVRVLATLTLATICLIPAPPLGQEISPAPTLRFVNGLWFDGKGFVPRTVRVQGGTFLDESSTEADETIDLEGAFVTPPLADAHTHGFADGGELERQIAEALEIGVFYAKNANSTAAGVASGRAALDEFGSLEAIYSGSGLTSKGGHPAQIYRHFPGLSEDDRGYHEIMNEADLAAAWPRILAPKPQFVKVMLEVSEEYELRRDEDDYFGKRGLDPALLPRVVQRAHKDGLSVSAHVTSATDFRLAVEAGVDEINHLPLERLERKDAENCAKANVVVVTTVLSHRPSSHVLDLDEVHRHNLALLRSAGVHLALGTDNPQGTLLDELHAIQKLGVFGNAELLRIATTASVKAIFPERRLGTLETGQEASFLALGTNPLTDPGAFRQVRYRLKRGRVVDVPQLPESEELPSIAQALFPLLHSGGIDAALARYHELLQEAPDEYDFSEPQLNAFGYALLNHDQAPSAVRVFELNRQRFPHSPNVYDSLADGYLAVGNTEKALVCYRKVLELLPQSPGYPESLRQRLTEKARAQLGPQEKTP